MVQTYDIIIFTIDYKTELPAIFRAFKDEDIKSIKFSTLSESFWTTTISEIGGRKIKILIAAIGSAGNTESGIFTSKILNQFKPNLAVLIGTCCGIKDKVEINQVVVGSSLYYFPRVRAEIDGDKPRFQVLNLNSKLKSTLQLYISSLQGGNIGYADKQRTHSEFAEINPLVNTMFAGIAVVEKLLVDGSLEGYRDSHESILVGDMDSYGFAKACDDQNINWLVTRGVSDYGEPDSKDGANKDKFHLTATYAAAEFIVKFIKQGLELDTIFKNPQIHSYSSDFSNNFKPLKIERVLISSQDKVALDELVNYFISIGIEIIATTNTYHLLQEYSDKIIHLLDYIKCEKIMNIRGSLHPYILAAIKASKDDANTVNLLKKYGVGIIDLIVLNSPSQKFNLAIENNDLEKLLEKIQLGSNGLLRWTIRNFVNCSIVTTTNEYDKLIKEMKLNGQFLSSGFRVKLFKKALLYLKNKDAELNELLEELPLTNI